MKSPSKAPAAAPEVQTRYSFYDARDYRTHEKDVTEDNDTNDEDATLLVEEAEVEADEERIPHVEDILKSLQETEQGMGILRGHEPLQSEEEEEEEQVNEVEEEGEEGIELSHHERALSEFSIKAVTGAHDLNLNASSTNSTPDNAHNDYNEHDDDDDQEYTEEVHDTARDLLLNASQISHIEAHERAIREALYLVRVRSQHRRRASLSKREHGNSLDYLKNKERTANANDGESGVDAQGAILNAKEEEWKARRAEMALEVEKISGDHYDHQNHHLHNPQGQGQGQGPFLSMPETVPMQSLTKTELGRVSTSGSQSTIANSSNHHAHPPLPLGPVKTTHSSPHVKPPLATATEFENQLLSPAVDVRKVVAGLAGSAVELFRPPFPQEVQSTLMNPIQDATSPTTTSNCCGLDGLELATPILSQQSQSTATGTTTTTTTTTTTPIRNPEGVMLMTSTTPTTLTTPTTSNTATKAPSPPRSFPVVPSSPAPHHVNYGTSGGGTNNSGGGGCGSMTQSISNSTHKYSTELLETAEMRRVRLELERQWRMEEEIERGVEQVLIAILERASHVQQQHDTGAQVLDAVDMQEDLINRAFSNLFSHQGGMGSLSSAAPKMRLARVASCDEGEEQVGELNMIEDTGKSIVDELLAETDTDDFGESSVGVQGDGEEWKVVQTEDKSLLSLGVETEGAPQAPTDLEDSLLSLTISSDPENDDYDVSTSIHPYTNAYDGILEVEAIEKASPQSSKNKELLMEDKVLDEDHNSEYNGMVLGPLSKEVGGTTGVVLQNEDEQYADPVEEILSAHEMTVAAESQDTNGSADRKSHSIIESITNAVRKGPGDIIAAFSGETSSVVASPASAKIIDGDSQAEMNKSSALLIRHLYAHILPVTPAAPKRKRTHTKSSSFSTWFSDYVIGQNMSHAPMHEWDDDDPDEPGYTVHTLSKGQLQHIEHEFESMMTRFEQRPKSIDEAISKDLEEDLTEAEDLLLDPTKKVKPQKKKVLRKNSIKKPTPKKKVVPTKLKSKPMNALATNPCFPSAKPAGTGEVGDLELYHLPIIYKANQTGFEPTKDLVLQPDTVFAGKYYVQSELGSAAFSTAYRCVDLNSGKKGEDGEMYYDEVCLKVIKNTKDFFDQSLDEIKILELLRQTNKCHEHNILEMKAFFYHKEHLIIVTELLRQNLFEFGKYIIENDEPRYFTRQRLCYIARQCLVALSFVHKLDLVHSDIKPENILLASYSRAKVKVIDFGSSCYLSDRQSSYIQSRSYRAPEVVLGLPYNGKIDIWSLGCVIAEMYTGQVTFQNDSIVSMLSRIEAICGSFPRDMIENGRQSGQFFTQSGLLYERATGDEDSEMDVTYGEDDASLNDASLFHIFQPKQTTMAARLGFESNLLDRRRTSWEDDDRALFVDFIQKLLTIDPGKRPTADEALEHPWILSGFNLTDDELKYPPDE